MVMLSAASSMHPYCHAALLVMHAHAQANDLDWPRNELEKGRRKSAEAPADCDDGMTRFNRGSELSVHTYSTGHPVHLSSPQ